MASPKDIYSNKAYGSVLESAANTLTFAEIRTNVNVFSKIAWIVNRVEWYVNVATVGLILAGADGLLMALTASDNIPDLGLDNPSVIDLNQWSLFLVTSGMEMINMPLIRDFSALPGGGLIIAPRPLFVAVQGISLATPATVECRISFRQIEMSAVEYLELIDFYRIVS